MRVALCSLVLNEMEWLPLSWEQHKDWPGLCAWVFVEAADREYARANPTEVSAAGLSVDGTTGFLRQLPLADPRAVYVPHGFSSGPSPERGKCEARQRYFDVLESLRVRPDYVVMLDGDEFYAREDQERLNEVMRRLPRENASAVIPKREIWRPPFWHDQPVPRYEAVGGFWKMPCCHWWRWVPGMHHRDCHNTPTLPNGVPVNRTALWLDKDPDAPQMLHMGFASRPRFRLAKNRYYAARGESLDVQRLWHVQARAEWEAWRPGQLLTRGGRVIPYEGPVPECFRADLEGEP